MCWQIRILNEKDVFLPSFCAKANFLLLPLLRHFNPLFFESSKLEIFLLILRKQNCVFTVFKASDHERENVIDFPVFFTSATTSFMRNLYQEIRYSTSDPQFVSEVDLCFSSET